ncbi:MAG: hypothetical protein E7375_04150 [Clostridiales bacterium]|nr:hypothetical protein [Clostridiales bacterium]
MKKILIGTTAVALSVLLVGCGSSANNATITNLGNQLDATANTISKVQTVNPSDITLSRTALDKIATNQMYRNMANTQDALKHEEFYKTEILDKTAQIKNCLDNNVKLSKAQQTAVKDLTDSLGRYTNSVAYTRNELSNTIKNISSLKRNPAKNADKIGAKLNKLSCNSNARSCYYENILNTLEELGCYFCDCDSKNSIDTNSSNKNTYISNENDKIATLEEPIKDEKTNKAPVRNIDTYGPTTRNIDTFYANNYYRNGFGRNNFYRNGYGYGVNNFNRYGFAPNNGYYGNYPYGNSNDFNRATYPYGPTRMVNGEQTTPAPRLDEYERLDENNTIEKVDPNRENQTTNTETKTLTDKKEPVSTTSTQNQTTLNLQKKDGSVSSENKLPDNNSTTLKKTTTNTTNTNKIVNQNESTPPKRLTKDIVEEDLKVVAYNNNKALAFEFDINSKIEKLLK